MVNLDEAVQEFLIESRENLDQLDRDFVTLETQPGNRDKTAAIFRTIHTIKGTAGFLGFGKLESLTHAGETLLSQVRDGTVALDADLTSALLAMVDRVRAMLKLVESTGNDGDVAHDDLITRLNDLRVARTQAPRSTTSTPPTAAAPAAPPAAAAPALPPAAAPAAAASAVPAGARPVSPPANSSAKPAPAAAPTETTTSDLNVRVDVGLLDKLMNLVGELVLARNQLVQIGARLDDQAFSSAAQRLSLITTELQENVMKTRMQPIGTVWSKLPRVVRDLAVQLGKQVRIEMVGQETELDRTILEAIKDALTHIVRNSVDHGMELPDVRAAAGKPKTGTLTLRAFHEGGQVNVEIADDGAGVNIEAVKRKAIERGLVSADRAARMGDFELTQLIFLPGFSTAEKVSNISGRGVGMDVVKTNVERIGGTVDVVSRPGQGTTLRIKIPLTLAIIPALIVASDRQRYAIPQVNLVELVRIEPDAAQGIERIRGSAFFRLRGELLPLVFLGDELRGNASRPGSGAPPASAARILDVDTARARIRGLVPLLARHVAEGGGAAPPGPDVASILAALQSLLDPHDQGASAAAAAAHRAFASAVDAVLQAQAAGDVGGAFRALGELTPLAARLEESIVAVLARRAESAGTNVVVLQADEQLFGLVVDEVLDTEEIVVKPLGKELKGIAVFAGATIMGDGRVALILDVAGLAQHAEAVAADRTDELDDVELDEAKVRAQQQGDDKQTLLLFSVGDDEVMAIPLSAVARIEEFPFDKIERVGRRPVVQYRGAILPLVELGPVLSQRATAEERRPVHVIVYASGERTVGLVVQSILDVVSESLQVDRSAARSSVVGAAVVQGRVIEILDAEDVLRTQAPTLLPRSAL